MKTINERRIDMKIKDSEFYCSMCEMVFFKARSDEEAMKEKEELFPEFPIEACMLVCDDCFNERYKNDN